ncbi:hypothetical protein [Aureibacillus halotolerans]|uniref:Uncharacterized protein n=1 Tax=Aureibacillus halotolerans TaxID=1508390 RepID=A0A4R6UB87_9BACI|nr:hypothetical protein [Aureibacillus halotolerans]TDQ40344.1 hypothetical protein EV213_10660 [Aureibacillus halotolerans]
MDENIAYERLLEQMKKRLWMRHNARFFQWLLAICACMICLITLVARYIELPSMLLLWGIGSGLGSIGIAVLWWKTRPTRLSAAQMYDRESADDAVVTAMQFAEDDEFIAILQRRDAVRRMQDTKSHVFAIVKPIWHWRPLALVAVCAMVVGASLFYPSQMMKTAAQASTHQTLMSEPKALVDQLLEEEKQDELMEKLQQLKEAMKEAKTAQELQKQLEESAAEMASIQADKQPEQQELKEMQDKLEEAGLKSLAEALSEQDKQRVEQAMKELQQQFESLTQEQKQMLANMAQGPQENKEEMLSALEKQLMEALQAGQLAQQSAQLQQQLQQAASSLSAAMAQAGLPSSPSAGTLSGNAAQGDSSNGQSTGDSSASGGDNSSSSQSDGTSESTAQGQGASSNQGQTGAANGEGNGSGNGNGNGGSGSNGGGRSETSGNGGLYGGTGIGDRDRLTFPERISGEETTYTDSGRLGDGASEKETVADAPSQRGHVQSYEEAYGAYEQHYIESVDRQQLPPKLETAVKNYFLDIQPEGGN